MTPDLQPQIQRTKRIDLIYRVFLFVLVAYMVAVVTYSAVKISEQTTFIINYLRCIGQTPQERRGPKMTNVCFERYAPKNSAVPTTDRK